MFQFEDGTFWKYDIKQVFLRIRQRPYKQHYNGIIRNKFTVSGPQNPAESTSIPLKAKLSMISEQVVS